jgi:hypothetical protein
MQNNKKDKVMKNLILYTLTQITELYPPLRITQHLSYVIDAAKGEFYNWSDERLLHELEKYQNKLESEYDDLEEEPIDG